MQSARLLRRIAVVTGGGDCPGLNAVIRAVVLTLHGVGGFEVLGIEDAFHGLLADDWESAGLRVLTPATVRDLLSRGGTLIGTSNRGNPFAYVSPRSPGDVPVNASARLLERLNALDVEGVISIGGDGSMRITAELSALGMKVVGVPKSIDNDLGATDQTFGFDTALHVVTDALDRLQDTAASHHRVMLLEVMGRDAGWIALHAGIAGGADVILLPEIPYSVDAVVDAVRAAQSGARRHVVIVVGEGARPLSGAHSVMGHLPGGMPRLAGAAARVEFELRARLTQEMRVTVLGYGQRGGSPSPFDRVLSTRYGRAAAELVVKRGYGRMVALQNGDITSVPFVDVPRGSRLVDPTGELVETARAVGIRFGDEVPRA